MLKQINKLSTVQHWAQMVKTNKTWVKTWKPHKTLPFTKPSLCLGALASSGGCGHVSKSAHISSWGKSGPVGCTSDLLVWLGAVEFVARRSRFSTLSQPAVWQPGMVETLHRQCRVLEPRPHWPHYLTSSLRENRELLLPSQGCSQDLRVGGYIGCRLIPPGIWSHLWDYGTPNKCENAWQQHWPHWEMRNSRED